MVGILHFFTVYSPLVYLSLAIGALFAIRSLSQALQGKRDATFGLEKEIAQSRIIRTIAGIILIVLIAIGELILDVYLAPSLPAITALSTPTLNLQAIPTMTILPELSALQGITTPLILNTAAASGCIPGQIMLTFPKPGDQVSGTITLTGTVNIPNFGFFKYEVSQVGKENWKPIQIKRVVVQDDVLGPWDTNQPDLTPPGDYLIRLVVYDNQGTTLPPCVVPVRVVAP